MVHQFSNNYLEIAEELQSNVYLQYILSRDSENLEKSCLKDKAEKQYWMPVIFGLSGNTALKAGTSLLWESLNVLRNH